MKQLQVLIVSLIFFLFIGCGGPEQLDVYQIPKQQKNVIVYDKNLTVKDYAKPRTTPETLVDAALCPIMYVKNFLTFAILRGGGICAATFYKNGLSYNKNKYLFSVFGDRYYDNGFYMLSDVNRNAFLFTFNDNKLDIKYLRENGLKHSRDVWQYFDKNVYTLLSFDKLPYIYFRTSKAPNVNNKHHFTAVFVKKPTMTNLNDLLFLATTFNPTGFYIPIQPIYYYALHYEKDDIQQMLLKMYKKTAVLPSYPKYTVLLGNTNNDFKYMYESKSTIYLNKINDYKLREFLKINATSKKHPYNAILNTLNLLKTPHNPNFTNMHLTIDNLNDLETLVYVAMNYQNVDKKKLANKIAYNVDKYKNTTATQKVNFYKKLNQFNGYRNIFNPYINKLGDVYEYEQIKKLANTYNPKLFLHKREEYLKKYPNSKYKNKINDLIDTALLKSFTKKYLKNQACHYPQWKGKRVNDIPEGKGEITCKDYLGIALFYTPPSYSFDIHGYMKNGMFHPKKVSVFFDSQDKDGNTGYASSKIDSLSDFYNVVKKTINNAYKNYQKTKKTVKVKNISIEFDELHGDTQIYNVYINSNQYDGNIYYNLKHKTIDISLNHNKQIVTGSLDYYSRILTTPSCGDIRVYSEKDAVKKVAKCAYFGHY